MKPSGSDNPDPTIKFLRIRILSKHSDPQLQFFSGSSNNCPVQSCFVGSLQPAIQPVSTPFLAGQMIKFSGFKNAISTTFQHEAKFEGSSWLVA